MGNEHSVQFAGRPLGRERHICALFNSVDEEHRVLRSFIKEGFDRGEKAFHIVDPRLRDEHLMRLGEAGIDVEGAIGSGQLQVRVWQECQFRGDRFDQDAMLALIEEVLQSGAGAGYRLTRFLGHMEWALLDQPGLDELSFVEFETRVNYLSPKYEDPLICASGCCSRTRSSFPPISCSSSCGSEGPLAHDTGALSHHGFGGRDPPATKGAQRPRGAFDDPGSVGR